MAIRQDLANLKDMLTGIKLNLTEYLTSINEMKSKQEEQMDENDLNKAIDSSESFPSDHYSLHSSLLHEGSSTTSICPHSCLSLLLNHQTTNRAIL